MRSMWGTTKWRLENLCSTKDGTQNVSDAWIGRRLDWQRSEADRIGYYLPGEESVFIISANSFYK